MVDFWHQRSYLNSKNDPLTLEITVKWYKLMYGCLVASEITSKGKDYVANTNARIMLEICTNVRMMFKIITYARMASEITVKYECNVKTNVIQFAKSSVCLVSHPKNLLFMHI